MLTKTKSTWNKNKNINLAHFYNQRGMGDGSHVCDILDPGFNSPVLCFPYPVMFTLLFNEVLYNLVAFFPSK